MIRAIQAVYSYYLPEVRQIISDLAGEFPHDVFLKSVTPGLDDFHEPIIGQFLEYQSGAVPGLSSYGNRYPTAGSEEFIREYITQLDARKIHVLEGEYEGYREIARTRGIETVEVPFEKNPADFEPGDWFLSNPSARDGNIIDDGHVQAICEAGHKLFYDLSYLGSTPFHRFDVGHPNIAAVAVSFSKSYGLFYNRVGFGFSREPLDVLYANKWFKNIFSLLIAQRLMETLPPGRVPEKYKPVQARIVETINAEEGLRMEASDAFLIARLGPTDGLDGEQRKSIEKFRRGPGHRFCLTPYFMEFEKRPSSFR